MRRDALAVLFALLVAPAPTHAEEPSRQQVDALLQDNRDLRRHNEDLERRLGELERRERERSRADDERTLGAPLADWTRRVRLGGSANAGYYRGSDETFFEDASFQVWDARFFLDADLGRDIAVGETPIARNAGLTFEWNAVRLGEVQTGDGATMIGETYVELQGVGGSRWANLQVGRFQIPVGENYLRFSKGYRDNPFITNAVGGPWWWDEGVRIHGTSEGGRFGYVASISDGETDFEEDTSREPQLTLKLYANPTPWLHASVSALRSGEAEAGALWLGETWATPIGSLGFLPTWQDGEPIYGQPDERIDSTLLLGADVVLTHERLGRLWLAFGHYAIDAPRGSQGDRDLLYWIAEWMLGGDAIAPELAPFYLALRANGLGTYDDGEGYVLDVSDAFRVGYNQEALEAYSIALGWRMTRWTTLRLEYTRRQMRLVDGVPRSFRNDAGGSDLFGVELGAAF
ncbi:MAG: hypothetical protein DCC71_14605 [Proteobacteria bacterium]|nr:MAG: hypothetical protein DCC71_14605 [Pseudomonadota bacterium]